MANVEQYPTRAQYDEDTAIGRGNEGALVGDHDGLSALIEAKRQSLTGAERRVAEVLLKSEEIAALYTAGEIARMAGTSDSTVIRLSRSLGLSGYLEMQRLARRKVVEELNSRTPDRLYAAGESLSDEDLIGRVFAKDALNLQVTAKNLSRKVFAELVSDLVQARRVYVVGSRTGSSITGLLAFCLRLLREDVRSLSGRLEEDYDQLLLAGPQDAMIGISMARYANHTLSVMKMAGQKGVRLYGVTDSLIAPINNYTSRILLVSNDSLSITPSTTAVVAFIHVLIAAVGLELTRRGGGIDERLNELEEMYDEVGIYWKDV